MYVAEPNSMAAQLTIPQLSTHRTKRVVHVGVEPKHWLHRLFTVFKIALVLLVIGMAVTGYFAYKSYQVFAELVDRQIAGGYLRGHAGLYAAPRVIEKGARLSKEQLVSSLQKAGYVSGATSNIWSGSYSLIGDSVRVSPRQQTEKYEFIDINFDRHDHIASLAASDGSSISSYSLEPELLTDDAQLKIGEQKTLTYKDLPPVLVNAIVAIEDRRFFNHPGLDMRGIARAFVNWAGDGRFKFHQGGSTITQQLVKNTYLTPEKTFRRKFNEAMIALALEQRLSKEDIFALYCNEIYLGQRDGLGVRGVAQAASVYFGKELKDLTLDEAATIAGMIQSPARYAPDRHPESSKRRRDQVLAAMDAVGFVDGSTAQVAMAEPIKVAPAKNNHSQFAPYYVDAVNRAVENAQLEVESDNDQNTRVQTTIDPDLQAAAEHALRHQLDLLQKAGKKPQGALVAMDVHTGHVLAMVGGSDYAESQLNRATDAKRQPGSVFKPFVYATAFESGISPLALFRDEPQTFEYGAASYSPANYGRAYSMHPVLLRDALVRSLNTITVDVAMRTGLTRISSTAARFGLTPPPVAYPSLALGTAEATPLEIAAAYAAFANGGARMEPILIERAVDSSGNRLIDATATRSSIIKPTTAYMITDILQDVIKRGTARRASGSMKGVAIAGKTGTSRDGWFVGYTPNLVCAVWVGYDDNKQLGLTGAEAALPAWIDFMKEAVAIRPSLGGSAFAKPAGIVTVKIDPDSGFLAGPDCPVAQTVMVASQFAPMADCYVHSPEYQMANYSDSELDAGDSAVESADDDAQGTEAGGASQTMPEVEPKMIGADESQPQSANNIANNDDQVVDSQSLQVVQPKPKPKLSQPKRVLETLRRIPE